MRKARDEVNDPSIDAMQLVPSMKTAGKDSEYAKVMTAYQRVGMLYERRAAVKTWVQYDLVPIPAFT